MNNKLTTQDITLMKTAWQLSLDHGDNEFDNAMIEAELSNQGIDNISDKVLTRTIIRMLDLYLIEVREVGSLYRCAWTCSSSSKIELTIVPCNYDLHRDVLKAVTEAVKKFGDLVDAESDLYDE